MEIFHHKKKDEQMVRKALLKSATGYDYEEKVIEARKDGTQGKVKIIKKHVPPNPKAAEIIYEMMRCGQW